MLSCPTRHKIIANGLAFLGEESVSSLAQQLRAGWIPTFGSPMECTPKVRFATDSALEEGVLSELVSRLEVSTNSNVPEAIQRRRVPEIEQ
jgi:hypothetical protein